MKLLASDYDGTLCLEQKVAPEDRNAIEQWRKEGNAFAIVTGRSLESMKKQLEQYGVTVDYLVTNNGGMIFDQDGKELLATQMDMITAIDLMYAAHHMDSIASYVVNDGYNRHKVVVDPRLEDHRYPTMEQDLKEEEVMDLGKFSQIVFSLSNKEDAIKLADRINHHFGNIVTAYANHYVVDVVPVGISKATGLEFITQYAQVNDQDVYAIGDAYNDVPMLATCDHAAAIEGAPEEVLMNVSSVYPNVSSYIQEIQNQQ